MSKVLVTIAVVALVLGSTCSNGEPSEQSPNQSTAECSAAAVEVSPAEQDLPEPVAEKRADIAEAARACDFDTLDELTADEGFTFSYGASEGSAGDYWEQLERDARGDSSLDAPLAILVKLLKTPHAVNSGEDRGIYTWPAIAVEQRPADEDWERLESVFPADRIERMKKSYEEHQITYLDWRIGITQQGEWIFFVAGD